MSTARKHKKRILEHLTALRAEFCICIEHGHLVYPPKPLKRYEEDTDDFIREMERTDFIERSEK